MSATEDEAEAATREKRLRAYRAWARTMTTSTRSAGGTRLADWRSRNAVVDAAMLTFERDRSVAGTVLSSALAFRLFLFFVPVVLVVVGILGLARPVVGVDEVTDTAGVTGVLADQMRVAMEQGATATWLTLLAGLFGTATAGRTLTKVLVAASSLAWRAPLRVKAGVRVIGTVIGIMLSLSLMAALVNRLRDQGVAVAGLSLLGAVGVYAVGWLVLGRTLPRTTSDPGAGLPGAFMVGFALAALQAVTQLYLPNQVSGASSLYGTIGAAIAVLGWFFIVGRVIVLSFVVDAVLYERFGSLSEVVFGLPVLRALPRRFPAVARFFDLGRQEQAAEGSAAEPEAEAEADDAS